HCHHTGLQSRDGSGDRLRPGRAVHRDGQYPAQVAAERFCRHAFALDHEESGKLAGDKPSFRHADDGGRGRYGPGGRADCGYELAARHCRHLHFRAALDRHVLQLSPVPSGPGVKERATRGSPYTAFLSESFLALVFLRSTLAARGTKLAMTRSITLIARSTPSSLRSFSASSAALRR